MSVSIEELAANPYAPPEEAAAPSAELVDSAALAGRGWRLLAVLIDSLFAAGPLFYVIVISEQAEATQNQLVLAGVLLIALAALFLVQCMLLARRGQTLGKMVCKVKIVRTDGSHASLYRILFLRIGVLMALRFLPYVENLVSLADALMIFRKDRRCLHDHIADTVVVTTRLPATDRAAPEPPPLPPEFAAIEPSAS